MNVIVDPERAAWVEPLLASVGPSRVSSPRALHAAAGIASRAWARGSADRVLELRFARRRFASELAARALPRDATAVYAPSGAAERVFAVARRRGIKTVLVHDLPSLRELHADLDAAARRFPDCRFLRRFRASRREIVRQETERALADEILVRGEHARALLVARGIEASRINRLPEHRVSSSPRAETPRSPLIVLAGFAAARSGANEALAVLDEIDDATLLVRAGEGTEPARLLRHPRVRAWNGDLRHVTAVIAPAWCESYPIENARASAQGIPIIGTLRALGFTSGTIVEPGDVGALCEGIKEVAERSQPDPPRGSR